MTMSILSQIVTLREALSSTSKILTDSTDTIFQELLQRWTDIDKKTPGAIVVPTSEDDILKTVGLNL